MSNYRSSISPKGQVTIPVEIRRQLGVQPKDHVVFRIVDGVVQIEPERATLETIYGSVRPLTPPRAWREIEEIAREELAANAAIEGTDNTQAER